MVNPGLTEAIYAQYRDMVRRVSSDFAKRYPMLDKDDIQQECWMWFLEHPHKVEEWSALDISERDPLFARSLRNAAMRYCVREKAQIEGYHYEDIFYYTKDFIKDLLPAVFSSDHRRVQQIFSDGGSGNKNVAETGDWMAYAADIQKAFYHLNEDEQKLVFLFYVQDVDGDTLKDASDDRPTARAAMMAANRAVGKMVKYLGGTKPVYKEKDYKKKEEIEQ